MTMVQNPGTLVKININIINKPARVFTHPNHPTLIYFERFNPRGLAPSCSHRSLDPTAHFLRVGMFSSIPSFRDSHHCSKRPGSLQLPFLVIIRSLRLPELCQISGTVGVFKDWRKFNMWVNYSNLWGIHIIAAALTIPSQNESAPSGSPQSPFIYSWNRNNSWK